MRSSQNQSDLDSARGQTTHKFDEPQQVDPANSLDDFDAQRRPWGFVSFILTALMLVAAVGQRAEPPQHQVVSAVMPLAAAGAATESSDSQTHAQQTLPKHEPEAQQRETLTHTMTLTHTIARASKARATRNVVSFESSSVATTEGAAAAVFVLTRSGPPHGRVRVRWSARSGTADAAIDFSDASGTAVLADGQAKVAIYVPLRNDLLQEADETFKVCLDSPQQARSSARCAEATIRDDDQLLSQR